MRKTKILSLVMALLMIAVIFAGCSNNNNGDPVETDAPVVYQEIDVNDAVTRTDFTSVYEKIGSKITIDMVEEKPNGIAYVTYEGKTYELGMDFLSMAMVYNTTVPANSEKYQTAEDVFNEWWKLYIQRWNMLVPEIPLYSNIYYDVYNAKIQNFVTTPYWGPADAIISATVKAGEANSVILGSATDLSGAFRSSSWGKSSPGASDLDIENLTSGHATMQTNSAGSYVWNTYVVDGEPVATMNEDGTLTYTIKIKSGLKFSDGSAITAKNYIAALLANSTEVAVAAGGTGSSGMYFKGYDEFNAYTGTNNGVTADGVTASKFFDGVKLIDDNTFSVTVVADYANYYYASTFAAFSPTPLALYFGDDTVEIVVDPQTKACGLSDNFYATEKVDNVDTYVQAAKIKANLKWNSALPYSGPYYVQKYDEATKVATLKLNPNYPGDTTRGKATIETITYVKIISETQLDQFKSGQVDILAGITGGTETDAALAVVNASNGKFAETHYDRAGYGKLGFRCDYGPTAFVAVRQAIMHTINRPQFAQTFTGGYGSVVHGPYYTGYSAYKACENTIKLNQYTYSKDSAIEVLEEGGWIYNVEGKTFDAAKDDIRYKKLEGYELTAENIAFKTVDGKYKTVKIDGAYYMPLAINWYGTQPNTVTDQLVIDWQSNNTATKEIGMYIQYITAEFYPALYGELYRYPSYGYDGTPKLNAVNFATGFTSTIYDYAFNWTIDPDMYSDYQMSFVMDEADFWANYQ